LIRRTGMTEAYGHGAGGDREPDPEKESREIASSRIENYVSDNRAERASRRPSHAGEPGNDSNRAQTEEFGNQTRKRRSGAAYSQSQKGCRYKEHTKLACKGQNEE
jgi:hypothetical protein